MLNLQLENYITTRQHEQLLTGKLYHHYFFCVGLGIRADIKIAAAEKLLRIVNTAAYEKFTEEEIDALNDGRLGRIIRQFENDLPVTYREQKIILEMQRAMRDRPEIII